MIEDILKRGNVFKLVCGAGNEDLEEVENLVALYSKAGCEIFDLSANPDVVDAAKRGLAHAGNLQNRYLCVSVGIKGDPHVSKAVINDNCKKCGKCEILCPQNAVKYFKVNSSKCIGCGRCVQACNAGAIKKRDMAKDLKEILPPIIKKGIDCIELHACGGNENDALEKWKDICTMFNGLKSLCIDRSKLGNDGVLKRVEKFCEKEKIIVQADGYPMSGGQDDYKSTLQAVAMAEIIQNSKLPVYLLISGGTNSKSYELSKLCGVDVNGVAVGSFARKIVKNYISQKDFLQNEERFNKALEIAKNLVNTVKYEYSDNR